MPESGVTFDQLLRTDRLVLNNPVSQRVPLVSHWDTWLTPLESYGVPVSHYKCVYARVGVVCVSLCMQAYMNFTGEGMKQVGHTGTLGHRVDFRVTTDTSYTKSCINLTHNQLIHQTINQLIQQLVKSLNTAIQRHSKSARFFFSPDLRRSCFPYTGVVISHRQQPSVTPPSSLWSARSRWLTPPKTQRIT